MKHRKSRMALAGFSVVVAGCGEIEPGAKDSAEMVCREIGAPVGSYPMPSNGDMMLLDEFGVGSMVVAVIECAPDFRRKDIGEMVVTLSGENTDQTNDYRKLCVIYGLPKPQGSDRESINYSSREALALCGLAGSGIRV